MDEAWIYQNEDEVGRALEEKIAAGAVKRGDLFVTSKLWNNFHRPELVKKGVQESLAKLKLAHLDLFLIHFPVAFRPDVVEATSAEEVEEVALEDTWRAMEALVDEGLATNIGVSNFEIEHLQRIQAIATKPIAVNQSVITRAPLSFSPSLMHFYPSPHQIIAKSGLKPSPTTNARPLWTTARPMALLSLRTRASARPEM